MAGKTWNTGDVLTAADMNEWGGGSTGMKYVSKPSDTSKTSNTTLANDPDLTLAVDANKSYHLELLINAYAGGGAGNIKTQLNVPASAVLYGGVWGAPVGGGFGGNGYDNAAQGIPSVGAVTHWGLTVADLPILWIGILVVAGTAGNVVLQWAQDTSSATSTIVRAGSWMLIRRVS